MQPSSPCRYASEAGPVGPRMLFLEPKGERQKPPATLLCAETGWLELTILRTRTRLPFLT
eukprot:2473812-Rhodomonas_salina.1